MDLYRPAWPYAKTYDSQFLLVGCARRFTEGYRHPGGRPPSSHFELNFALAGGLNRVPSPAGLQLKPVGKHLRPPFLAGGSARTAPPAYWTEKIQTGMTVAVPHREPAVTYNPAGYDSTNGDMAFKAMQWVQTM